MRPIASLALALILSGCGYNTWWNAPFTGGLNPNLPDGSSENMGRVQGQEPSVPPLTTEAGRIWPGPLPPPLTLQDLQATGGVTSQPEAPALGSPMRRSGGSPYPSPNPAAGSSTPPGTALPEIASPQPSSPLPSYASPPAAPPARGPAGQVIPTQEGPAVTTGGGTGYKTTINPGGGQSIVVPNGNGTSTVIHPDGRIETVPTPR
jgi:hypothetical protein